jgi:hypothetical protein
LTFEIFSTVPDQSHGETKGRDRNQLQHPVSKTSLFNRGNLDPDSPIQLPVVYKWNSLATMIIVASQHGVASNQTKKKEDQLEVIANKIEELLEKWESEDLQSAFWKAERVEINGCLTIEGMMVLKSGIP